MLATLRAELSEHDGFDWLFALGIGAIVIGFGGVAVLVVRGLVTWIKGRASPDATETGSVNAPAEGLQDQLSVEWFHATLTTAHLRKDVAPINIDWLGKWIELRLINRHTTRSLSLGFNLVLLVGDERVPIRERSLREFKALDSQRRYLIEPLSLPPQTTEEGTLYFLIHPQPRFADLTIVSKMPSLLEITDHLTGQTIDLDIGAPAATPSPRAKNSSPRVVASTNMRTEIDEDGIEHQHATVEPAAIPIGGNVPGREQASEDKRQGFSWSNMYAADEVQPYLHDSLLLTLKIRDDSRWRRGVFCIVHAPDGSEYHSPKMTTPKEQAEVKLVYPRDFGGGSPVEDGVYTVAWHGAASDDPAIIRSRPFPARLVVLSSFWEGRQPGQKLVLEESEAKQVIHGGHGRYLSEINDGPVP